MDDSCMIDKITVFNQALAQLGDREYIVDTPAARAVNLWWPSVLREAVSFAPWSWATKRMEVAGDVAVIELPPDCLKVLGVGADVFRVVGRTVYVELAGHRLTKEGNIWLDYLSDAWAIGEVLPEFSPFFVRGVVLLLAGRCALKLAGSAELAQGLEQQGYAWLRRAATDDAQQYESNDQDPLVGWMEGGYWV